MGKGRIPTKKPEKGEGERKNRKPEECGTQKPRKDGKLLFYGYRVSGVRKNFGNKQW